MSYLIVDNQHVKRYYNADNELHREDGPAIIYAAGLQSWWVNGTLHRTGGPAVIYADGRIFWYINGKRKIKNKSFQKAAKLTDEDMTALVLKHGNVK